MAKRDERAEYTATITDKQSKTLLHKSLKKMTLKNKAKLLDKTIEYYGLHYEPYIWDQINKLVQKK